MKNLAHPTDKILRCAQDDKQKGGSGEQGAGAGSENGEREIAGLWVLLGSGCWVEANLNLEMIAR